MNNQHHLDALTMKQFFEYEHLPAHLQDVSKPFGELAKHLIETLPHNIQLVAALQSLVTAKDQAVRAKLLKDLPAE